MKIIAKTKGGSILQQTGRARQIVRGAFVNNIKYLKIGRYDEDDGVYLLYYDSDGNEITDTWHENIGAALEQALFEFGATGEDWVFLS